MYAFVTSMLPGVEITNSVFNEVIVTEFPRIPGETTCPLTIRFEPSNSKFADPEIAFELLN
jgi:hypothetical protein